MGGAGYENHSSQRYRSVSGVRSQHSPLRIGLPKGLVPDKFRSQLSSYLRQTIDPTALHVSDAAGKVHFYFLKPRDIPGLIYARRLDAGITLTEWLVETGFLLHVQKTLDWCDTRLSLLVPEDMPWVRPTSCATEFPRVASRFFQEEGLQHCTTTRIHGSCEGLVPTLYDCVVDCVETGATALAHNLREATVLLISHTVLVTKEAAISRPLHNLIKELCYE